MDKNTDNMIDFLYEIGMQKRIKRSGWWVAGVKDPETVAEHSHRTSVLAYMLAKLEGIDPMKTAMMCMIHDVPESRVNDGHKVTARYINLREAELKVWEEQLELLPDPVKKDFFELYKEFNEESTKEAIVAKDADYLECAIQAKEYLDIGYKSVQNWIDNVEKKLKTKSAKHLLEELKNKDSKRWFIDLKKLE